MIPKTDPKNPNPFIIEKKLRRQIKMFERAIIAIEIDNIELRKLSWGESIIEENQKAIKILQNYKEEIEDEELNNIPEAHGFDNYGVNNE